MKVLTGLFELRFHIKFNYRFKFLKFMSLDSHTTPVNNWLLLPHYNVKSHPLNIPVCLLYSLLCILQKEIEESGFMIVFSKKYLI